MISFVLLLYNVMKLHPHWNMEIWGNLNLCFWATVTPIWLQKKKNLIPFEVRAVSFGVEANGSSELRLLHLCSGLLLAASQGGHAGPWNVITQSVMFPGC